MPHNYSWTPTKLVPTNASQVKVLTINDQPAALSTPVSVTAGTISFALTNAGRYKIVIQKGSERYTGLFDVDVSGTDVSQPEQYEYTRTATSDASGTGQAKTFTSTLTEAIGVELSSTSSPLKSALDKSRTKAAAGVTLYQPSSTSTIRWRHLRGETLANKRQGSITFLGDSIPFGAATTGASNPKWLNSYPGQLRTRLTTKFGTAGSGIVLANPNVRSTPAWDPRFTFGGTSFLDHAFGLHGSTAYRLNGGSDATLDFTDVADEFWVYTFSGSGGVFSMQVDSQTAVTGSLVSAGSGGTLARESGYFAVSGNAINVFKVPTGSTASHVLKIRPSGTAGQNLFVWGVEARVNGNGRFRINNASISGKSLQSFFGGNATPETYNDQTGLFGLPLIDSMKSDLLVIALGINDWQGQRPLSSVKTWLNVLIDRQRASSASAGTVPAKGDVMLLWNPKPDLATLAGGPASNSNPSWDQYRDLYYEVADEKDVALVDLGGAWKDYATANAHGLFADTIHPGDKGAADIAGLVERALFTEA